MFLGWDVGEDSLYSVVTVPTNRVKSAVVNIVDRSWSLVLTGEPVTRALFMISTISVSKLALPARVFGCQESDQAHHRDADDQPLRTGKPHMGSKLSFDTGERLANLGSSRPR